VSHIFSCTSKKRLQSSREKHQLSPGHIGLPRTRSTIPIDSGYDPDLDLKHVIYITTSVVDPDPVESASFWRNWFDTKKFQYTVKNIDNFDNYEAGKKDKIMETDNDSDFSPCVKLGVESGFGSGSLSKWKVGSGSGSTSRTMPILNTDYSLGYLEERIGGKWVSFTKICRHLDGDGLGARSG
jgi:hypothetical protein